MRLPVTIHLFVFAALSASSSAMAEISPPPASVLIPAGPFIMGTDAIESGTQSKDFGAKKPWYVDERPQRHITLQAFYIDRFEVSYRDYLPFVEAEQYADSITPQTWHQNGYVLNEAGLRNASTEMLRNLAVELFQIEGDVRSMNKSALITAITTQQRTMDHWPVSGITWFAARDYCAWRSARLPTEQEWEKAARGDQGREYPWGDKWDRTKLNSGDSQQEWKAGVAPVGSYPEGVSLYGVHDLAGNVMEWVADWYQPYPGNSYLSNAFGEQYKVVRGGGWGGEGHYAITHFYRAAYRFYLDPRSTFVDLGLRCAADAPAS